MTTKPKTVISKTKNGIYKRGNSYYILVKVGGKQRRKSFGKDRNAAVAALNAIQMRRATARATKDWSGLDGLFKRKITKTFAEAADDYIKERSHLKENTLRCYKEILKNYLLPTFGKMPLPMITEPAIAKFQSTLVKEKISPVRVNNIVGLLRYVLKVCARRKLIDDNPAVNVQPLTENEPDIDPFTTDELQLILDNTNPLYRALFVCQAWTGMRPNELFALKWTDVRFDQNSIYVRHGRVRGNEGTPKTRKSQRSIPMLSIVKQALLEHQQNSVRHIDNYVFLSRHDQPINKHLDREWKAAFKGIAVRYRPSYQLRHTFASLCLQQGCTPGWVAEVLGHSTMQTTFRHYARFIKNASQENEVRMEAFLQNEDYHNAKQRKQKLQK